MTGYTVHTGTSKKFAAGWDQIFSASKPASKGKSKKKVTKAAGAKPKKSTKKAKRGK